MEWQQTHPQQNLDRSTYASTHNSIDFHEKSSRDLQKRSTHCTEQKSFTEHYSEESRTRETVYRTERGTRKASRCSLPSISSLLLYATSDEEPLHEKTYRASPSAHVTSKDDIPYIGRKDRSSRLQASNSLDRSVHTIEQVYLPARKAEPANKDSIFKRRQSTTETTISTDADEYQNEEDFWNSKLTCDNRYPLSDTSDSPSAFQPWAHHHHSSPVMSLSISLSQDRYVCLQCDKAFSRPSSLRIHSHSHTGEKPFLCPYDGCGKAFSVRSNMKRHERGCHQMQ